jgi:predicted AlkP superfamily pyrophosphatase or phosphodiesterase
MFTEDLRTSGLLRTMDKVLVVGMDGLRHDVLVKADAPALQRLLAHGVHGTALLPYGVAPGQRQPGTAATDSGPGWSTIATGVWPEKHGVLDNTFAGSRFDRWPDFLTRAQAAGRATAAYLSWRELAGAFGPRIARRVVTDGDTDTYRAMDAHGASLVVPWFADHDLVFVYFGETDEVAHDAGPFDPAYAAALARQDAYLGRFLDVLDASPDSWTVIVTTDHGHRDLGGHGGVSHEERTTFVIVDDLAGPGPGIRLDEARIVDVAPTALQRLGLVADPSWDLDGAAIPRQ